MHHYGCRYAETCHYALSSFEEDQQQHKDSLRQLKTLSRSQEDPATRELSTRAQNTTPLKPVSATPMFYFPPYAKQHSISPFYMPDEHPQKHFMSGYTGFVPKAQKYLGQGYPIITRRALQDFAGEEKQLRATQNAPVSVSRPEVRARAQATVYSQDSGLMPHYTGHIPGLLVSSQHHAVGHSLDPIVGVPLSCLHVSCVMEVLFLAVLFLFPGEKFKYGTTFGYSTARVGVPQVQA